MSQAACESERRAWDDLTRFSHRREPTSDDVQRHGNLNNLGSSVEAQPEEKPYCEVDELE
jgi:hypothetical protein